MSRVPTERLQQIDYVFQTALDRPPAERSGYLRRVCGGDEALRRKVRRLLVADARARTFLEHPLRPTGSGATGVATREVTAGGNVPVPRPRQRSGPREDEHVGPYRLLRSIGKGGMSQVFLAERHGVARGGESGRVALKILRRGLDDPETLRRFSRERLLLARLRHPHIARLRGGGTARDGRPYLVMDYVDGWPIDDYCDRFRLSVNERLELFRKVCGAVQYAHRHGLVHRDLKPDNILVTDDGTPKLLDFGIAKLLDRTLLDLTVETTLAGVRLLTPGYASPEQFLGGSVTPASDTFSLGVLLYGLLTGRGPFRGDGAAHHVGLAICHREPPPPSTVVDLSEVLPGGVCVTPSSVSRDRRTSPRCLRRRLSGDLDAVLAKALRKVPGERYVSAAELDEDIARYLEGRCVAARKSTLLYRLGKLVRRHRLAFAVGLAAAGFAAGRILF